MDVWAYVTQYKFVCSTHSGGVVAKSCLTLVTPWTVARQVFLAMGFPRQECWSGFPVSFSRGSSEPRDRTQVSCFQADSLQTEPPGKLLNTQWGPTNQNIGVCPEKHLSQGWARRDGSCSKDPELPEKFWQSIFKGQVREGRPRICDQLVHSSLVDVEMAGG